MKANKGIAIGVASACALGLAIGMRVPVLGMPSSAPSNAPSNAPSSAPSSMSSSAPSPSVPSASMADTNNALVIMRAIRDGNPSTGYGMALESTPANVRVVAGDQTKSLLIGPQNGDSWAWVSQCAVQGTWADCASPDDSNPASGTGDTTSAIGAALDWLNN